MVLQSALAPRARREHAGRATAEDARLQAREQPDRVRSAHDAIALVHCVGVKCLKKLEFREVPLDVEESRHPQLLAGVGERACSRSEFAKSNVARQQHRQSRLFVDCLVELLLHELGAVMKRELGREVVERAVRDRERLHDRAATREEREELRQRLELEPRHVRVNQLLLDHRLHFLVRVVFEPVKTADAVEQPVGMRVHVVCNESELVAKLECREDEQQVAHVAVAGPPGVECDVGVVIVDQARDHRPTP